MPRWTGHANRIDETPDPENRAVTRLPDKRHHGPMSEQGAVEQYLQMLEEVGRRANVIGPRVIASHWPFIGSDYRRLLVVGQALAGWDDKTSSALWTAALAQTGDGRQTIVEGTRDYATAPPEPMTVPLRTRAHSPFWSLSRRTVQLLEPNGPGDWYSRFAWWNLFPLGWGDTNRSPWFDPLWDAQLPHIGRLFWEVVDAVDPTRIVILAGKDFWPHTAPALGLDDLPVLPRPLLAGGRRQSRAIVWTYHPGARLKGVTRPSFAAAITGVVHDIMHAE